MAASLPQEGRQSQDRNRDLARNAHPLERPVFDRVYEPCLLTRYHVLRVYLPIWFKVRANAMGYEFRDMKCS